MCTVGGMRRETAHRWTPSNTRVLASRVMVIDTGGPNHPTRNAARVDRVVVPTIASPAVRTITRLRSRTVIGLGRLLRGIAHTVLRACCTALPTPSPP